MDFDDFLDLVSVMSEHVISLPFSPENNDNPLLIGIFVNKVIMGLQDIW